MSLRERLRDTVVATETVREGVSAEAVVDPRLDDLKRRLHRRLIEECGPDITERDGSAVEDRVRLERTLREMLDDERTPLSSPDRREILTDVIDDVLGYGPIEAFLRDPRVTEIMVNNAETIYVERDGRIHATGKRFLDEGHLLRIIDKIVGQVGRRIDESVPMVDARLADGSRVNAIIHPLALNGPILTVRKFSAEPYTVADLTAFGTLTPQLARFLDACVRGRLNILISGGTGSGKTTLLNVMSAFVPHDERVVTIEDAAELKLGQEHVLRLESRPANIEGKGEVTIRDLVRNALRMRPDRIIVGEVRGGEALDMLQAMNTGHDGSLSTVHANSPRDALARIETMVLMSGFELPVRAIREQVSSAMDLLVHTVRFSDGTRRVVQVSEIQGMEGDVVLLQDLYAFDHRAGLDEQGRSRGILRPCGLRPRFAERLADRGLPLPPELFAVGYEES
jgi:pilus assembly protein CpaF